MGGIAKMTFLLAGMTALFMVIGQALGGTSGMMLALLLALAGNLFAYWSSDKMVLSMYGAQEVDEHSAPDLVHLVRDLAARGGLPMPRVYVIDSDQPNAFATGRDPAHAAVAATRGLLAGLNPNQVAGVLAHELAHIKNRDTLIMTITATLAGAISMIANFGLWFGPPRSSEEEGGSGAGGMIAGILLAILAPLAAMVIQMAISRSREYEADRVGAEICGQPLWLATALQAIEQGASEIPNPTADAHPASAHLFIINPLHGGGLAGLFSTHPATAERVRRLRTLAPVPARSAGGRRSDLPWPNQGPWG